MHLSYRSCIACSRCPSKSPLQLATFTTVARLQRDGSYRTIKNPTAVAIHPGSSLSKELLPKWVVLPRAGPYQQGVHADGEGKNEDDSGMSWCWGGREGGRVRWVGRQVVVLCSDCGAERVAACGGCGPGNGC